MSAAPETNIEIRPAVIDDAPLILAFIRELAKYEHLAHTVVATEDLLRQTLFGPKPAAEIRIATLNGNPAGSFFFQNYSTFVGRPGVYLRPVRPARVPGPWRRPRIASRSRPDRRAAPVRPIGMGCARLGMPLPSAFTRRSATADGRVDHFPRRR